MKKIQLGLSLVIAGVLLAGPPVAWGIRPADDLVDAVTSAEIDLELAFTISGMVAEVAMEPGRRVSAGDAIARLDDREMQASIATLRLRAESDLRIGEAQAALDLAINELARVEQAFELEAVSGFEVERKRLERKRAEVGLALARQKREEARLQLERSLVTLERYTLAAPADGIVEEVGVEVGETVRELQQVVRLVSIDPLRIDAAVPVEQTLSLRAGQRVEVHVGVEGAPAVWYATIIHIGHVADAASGTRLVRLRLPNPESLPAGLPVRVDLLSASMTGEAQRHQASP